MATERIALPAVRHRVSPGFASALVILLALVGGGLGGYRQQASGDRVLAHATVGPEGGFLPFASSGSILIPRGALPAPTPITIRRSSIRRRVRVGARGGEHQLVVGRGQLAMYVFEPSSLRFDKPVTIALPAEHGEDAALVDGASGVRVIFGDGRAQSLIVQASDFSFSP